MSLSATTDFDETSTTAAEFDAQKIVQANSTVLSADVNTLVEKALRRTKYLDNIKVDIAGDTMTGRLIVGAATATNHNAIQATGNGTGAGIVATGGTNGKGAEIQAGGGNNIGAYCAGSGNLPGVSALGGATGRGGEFLAGGGNTAGLSSTGTGTGAGASCTGGTTGPGIIATPGTAQSATVPQCAAQFAGYIQLTGTNPNPGVDPGANNVLHAMAIPKAWVLFDTSYNVLASYNVASITTVLGDIKRLDFVRPMASVNYGIKFAVHGAPGGDGSHNGNKDVDGFEFVLFDTTDASPGFPTSTTEAYIEVMGVQ